MKKRIVCLLLALAMMLSFMPQFAMKAEAADDSATKWDVINTKGVSGEDIVARARTYLGVPYTTHGGDYKYRTGFGATMMFDCSGFVYRVCRDVGLASSRKNSTMGVTDNEGKPLEGQDANGNYYITANTQNQRYYGQDISAAVQKYIQTGDYSDLRPGDLLFISKNNSTTVTHVAIYAGNGKIIHCEGYYGSVVEHPINRYHSSKNDDYYFDGCRLVDQTYLSKCTTYPSYCTIKTTKKTYIKSLPCSEDTDANSKNVETASSGASYVAIGLVKNTAGNLWYKVQAKNGSTGYMYAGDTTFVSRKTDDIKGPDITVPTNHVAGKSYVLTGKVTTVYNGLDKVSVYVYAGTSTEGTAETGSSATASGNSFTLKGSTIDSNTKFGSLKVGSHTYVVSATCINYYAKDATTPVKYRYTTSVYKATFSVVSSASCSHSYSAATCTKPKTCTKCGATSGSALNHTYTNACDTSCNRCGATRTITHSYKDATCTAPKTCTVCGATTGSALNHSYTNACDTSCNRCGATRTITHSYKDATCTAPKTCTVCGATSGSALGHTYDSDADNTCNRCGEERETVVAPTEPTPPSTKPVEDPWYLTYEIVDGEAIITDCDESVSGELIIPDTLGGCPVTAVGDQAFDYCYNLTSITLPDSLITIGIIAFNECTGLRSINLPKSITTISGHAFQFCNGLVDITIPDSVTTIGEYAFASCDNLTSVTFSSNVATVCEYAFFDCPSLTDVHYGGTQSQWGQISIHFTNSELTSATIHFADEPAKITSQPKTAKVAAGKTAKFTVKATGDGLTYQWQSSADGKSWKNCTSSSATSATFTFTGKSSHSSNYYRCKVTDSAGNTVYTDTVRLYVLGVTTQPKTQKVEVGEKVKYTVKATGAGKTYQWQSSADGKTWKNCSSKSAKYATFSFTSKTSHSGNYYRCKITDNAGNVVYTSAVRLYVLGITEQPVSKTVTKGKTAKFTVEATGASKVYQWQYSTDGGKTWKNCSSSSAKKATFSFTTKTSHNGNYYRCRIKDSGGNTVYTSKVKLTVKK